MSTSMGLPVTAQGTPPVSSLGNGFGQPSAVAIGQPQSEFGGVGSVIPAQTYQNIVGPRNNIRFNVQPQVTVAVRPSFPLSEGIRRKDFLMTMGGGALTHHKRYGLKGTPVIGIQQVNAVLYDITHAGNNNELTPVARHVKVGLDTDSGGNYKTGSYNNAGDDEKLLRVFNAIVPFGVYNNRGTFDAQEELGQVPNSTLSNIIGVNVSNYCFMRDIWGSGVRQGDSLELWYIINTVTNSPEIWPVAGCIEDENGRPEKKWLEKTFGASDLFSSLANQPGSLSVLRYRIGRVWAKPLHAAFQRTSHVNIVGPEADIPKETNSFGSITEPTMVYKNIEVELCPNCIMNNC